MLRLERLEISGFKSFADKTVLDFREGITGVVGPNGCGKSNIAEAISWVLGEQSAKTLRGSKMEDVIFNGTRDRKPMGVAEVTLKLLATADITSQDNDDNTGEDEKKFDEAIETAGRAAEAAETLIKQADQSDAPAAEIPATEGQGALPTSAESAGEVESSQAPPDGEPNAQASETESAKHAKKTYRPKKRARVLLSAGDKITIGRRLYRTGESDYLMNGRLCLLRDIQDLFAGTGLGGAHYAIIEQGKIGQILSSKPLDRRALIEEAAGITKFKSRKRLAELKIEAARQNLTRLNDIISEVERQVNSLKRQAAKARRYRRLRDEMRSLLKHVFTADYYRLTNTANEIAAQLEQTQRAIAELDTAVAEREDEYKAVSTEARAAEDNLSVLKENASAVDLDLDRVRNRRKFEEQQLTDLNKRLEENGRAQQSLTDRLSMLDTEIERKGADLKTLQTEVSAQQAELLTREQRYQADLNRVREAESHIEKLRQQLFGESAKAERLRSNLSSLEDALRRLDLRRTNLEAEMERARERSEELSTSRTQLERDMANAHASLMELSERMTGTAEQLQNTGEKVSQARGQLEAVQADKTAAERLLESLKEVDARHAYYSDAVQQVLAPEHAARLNALGTLADFVHVEPQYERLIESLFGRELQSVLVPTIDDALAGVEYLKAEGLGRGAFLVVGLHGAEEDPSEFLVESPASDDGKESASVPSEYPGHLPTEGFTIEAGNSGGIRFQLEILRAIELMSLRPEIKSIVERAFPDKCGACVVPDVEAALQLSMENGWRTYVTYEGEQVVNGRLIVTSAQAGTKGMSLLAIKREIRQLTDRTTTLHQEETVLAETLASAKALLQQAEAESAALQNEFRQQEKSAAALQSEFDSRGRELERAEQHVQVVVAELEQTSEERREFENKIAEATVTLTAAEGTRNIAQHTLTQAQTEFAAMRSDVEKLSEEVSAARAASAARVERLRAAQSEIRRLENEAEELNSRINRIRLEMYEGQSRVEQLKASFEEAGVELTRLETESARLSGEVTAATEHLTSVRTRSDQLGAALADIRTSVAAAREQRAHIEVEQARIQSEADHLSKMCIAELTMPLQEVVASVEGSLASGEQANEDLELIEDRLESTESEEGDGETTESVEVSEVREESEAVPTFRVSTESTATESEARALFDVDAARIRLDEIRAKLEDMGSVNMMALEELEESENRFSFLSTQRVDILESIKGTEEALAEIKKRSRERFRHAFTVINENFQRMFIELFGGGRGEMILIDEEDVLESGIDLIAQPPGKRLQNVLLLSGGEKAMAALALVLAIFEFRPSPFCILDEVDAPLDEANVGRFASKVSEMSSGTQFLMITHNKRSMEVARALYGVTMEEPGVSKLVSVRFD